MQPAIYLFISGWKYTPPIIRCGQFIYEPGFPEAPHARWFSRCREIFYRLAQVASEELDAAVHLA